MINIGWPEGIMIAFMFMNLFLSAVKHGEPREQNFNFLVTIVSTMLSLMLLYFGGFFS